MRIQRFPKRPVLFFNKPLQFLKLCYNIPIVRKEGNEMKKTIVLGVCGGIAAFKAAQLTSDLIKAGYDVEVIMTENATQFVAPLTFEALISHNVVVDTFEKVQNRSIHHISLAKKADLFILVPASANVIAKVAHGIADDMLTTTFLACSRQKVICPAMNTQMYENPITQRNLQLCREYGYDILEPASGHLACGDSRQRQAVRSQRHHELCGTLLPPRRSAEGTPRPHHRRPDPGSARSGALPHQPLIRKDGLCARAGSSGHGGRGHAHQRSGASAAARTGAGDPRDHRSRDVRSRARAL